MERKCAAARCRRGQTNETFQALRLALGDSGGARIVTLNTLGRAAPGPFPLYICVRVRVGLPANALVMAAQQVAIRQINQVDEVLIRAHALLQRRLERRMPQADEDDLG